jgi:hypothetical protein
MSRRGETTMTWLKRKIRNWLNQDEMYATVTENKLVARSDSIQSSGMNFSLYKAVGGHILEARSYDQRTDRHIGTLYMIQEDDDFAKQVAQAIMLEQMKL